MFKQTTALKKMRQRVNQIGIDLVDPIVAFVARTITNVFTIDSDNDGKVEGGEILNFAYKTGLDAFGNFRGFSWPKFRAQIADADPEERQKLIATFAAEFDLSNDEAEWLIEDWLRHLDQTAVLVERTRKVLGRKAMAA